MGFLEKLFRIDARAYAKIRKKHALLLIMKMNSRK